MRRRHNPFGNRIELYEGKIIKTRRFKYIAESSDREDRCNECALDGKRFECRKMRCQRVKHIDRVIRIESFILKQIE